MGNECSCISATILEETIQATVVEEVIQPTVTNETICATVTNEQVTSVVMQETIEATISEETIEVTFACGWCTGTSGSGGKVEIEFTYSDIIAGPIEIGRIGVTSNIHSTFIDIDTPFDGDFTLSIGTDSDNDFLMKEDENAPDVANQYMAINNIDLQSAQTFKLFANINVAPTHGAGRATIYYY